MILARRWTGPAAVGLAVAASGGLVLGLAAAVGAAAAVRRLNAVVAGRSLAADRAAFLEAVGALAEELRAGRPPPAALAAAADMLPSSWSGLAMREAAAASALGGDPAVVLRRAVVVDDRGGGRAVGAAGADPGVRASSDRPPPPSDSVITDGLARVAAAWQVSLRSGAPLSDTLDRLERDLRSAARARSRLAAELAGPRATAALLAGLPVLGVVLGAAMGADPIHVLLRTAPGQVALLVGVTLDAAGLRWTERILRSADPVALRR
jgi:tight adherence protein B